MPRSNSRAVTKSLAALRGVNRNWTVTAAGIQEDGEATYSLEMRREIGSTVACRGRRVMLMFIDFGDLVKRGFSCVPVLEHGSAEVLSQKRMLLC
jgi:hypothetical protein